MTEQQRMDDLERHELHRLLAAELAESTATRIPVAPLRDRVPAMTLDDAYAIQTIQLDARRAAGRTLVGRKIGLTSLAIQTQLGVNSPDFGFVMDDMVHADGDLISARQFVAPRVEPELGFVLKSQLKGPGVTVDDAAQAVEFVFAAIEIIDSRVENWDIGLLDTVADNASCGATVLGRVPLNVAAAETVTVAAEIAVNGEVRESGLGSAVLGDPVAPLAWLANVLGERGVALEAGQVVFTGSFTRAVPVAAGDVVTARFGTLGSLSITFV